MIQFKIYRQSSGEVAHNFDMGDLEFVFDEEKISSCGNSRFLNMIYISISDLIDDLLRLRQNGEGLKRGGRNFEFVAADSSFVVRFEIRGGRLSVSHEKQKIESIFLIELLQAIDRGIDYFLADPGNELPVDGSMYFDFHASRTALKKALLAK